MISDAKKKADIKYKKANRAQIVLDVSKAQREQINDYCKQFGSNTGSYIKQLIRNDMAANGVRPIEANEEYNNLGGI